MLILGKGTCTRQSKADPSGKNPVGSGIGKKDGEVIRRPSQTRRTTTRSKATAAPETMSNLVACPALALLVRSLEATTRRSHAEARGDLHGRKHAHVLRRVCFFNTRASPTGQICGPARRSSAWRPKVGRAIRRCRRNGPGLDPQCRRLKCLTSRFDRSFRTGA